jgi:predicted nucleic acid-binding protein
MSSFGVVLDACVLIKASLRDTMIRAYGADLYRLHWSDDILIEVHRNLVENGMTTESGAERLDRALRTVLESAEVTGYRPLIPSLTIHPKDRHVLAAAITAAAKRIVTENLRDFPATALEPFDLEAQSPDRFLVDLYNVDAEAMVQIIHEQSQATNRPHLPVTTILDHLERDGAPTFAALIRADLR